MKFFTLYLLSASSGAKSISRPGRTKAYSPMRRTIISPANMAKVGASARPIKPRQTSAGTSDSSTRTPSFCATLPVINT